ncbi:hypothetical protein ACA910_003507 [Epithemia clementina (nom. ined.)]
MQHVDRNSKRRKRRRALPSGGEGVKGQQRVNMENDTRTPEHLVRSRDMIKNPICEKSDLPSHSSHPKGREDDANGGIAMTRGRVSKRELLLDQGGIIWNQAAGKVASTPSAVESRKPEPATIGRDDIADKRDAKVKPTRIHPLKFPIR